MLSGYFNSVADFLCGDTVIVTTSSCIWCRANLKGEKGVVVGFGEREACVCVDFGDKVEHFLPRELKLISRPKADPEEDPDAVALRNQTFAPKTNNTVKHEVQHTLSVEVCIDFLTKCGYSLTLTRSPV